MQLFLRNLKKILGLTTLSFKEKSGHELDVKRVTESTLVVILTISIFISLLIGLTLMTLALGSGG